MKNQTRKGVFFSSCEILPDLGTSEKYLRHKRSVYIALSDRKNSSIEDDKKR